MPAIVAEVRTLSDSNATSLGQARGMRAPRFGLLLASFSLVFIGACSGGEEGGTSFSTGFATLPMTTSGDGDGDPGSSETGDGDGEPATGDGDGEPATGDGDGEPATGDGDGDPMNPDMPAQGGPLAVNELVPGDLVITEIMYNPNLCDDVRCEWIEVLNLSGSEVDLLGLRVQDVNLDMTGTIDVSLIVANGEYAWIGKGPMAEWGYPDPADAYIGTAPAFNNSGDDQAVLLNDTEILDSSALYSANDAGIGVSWQLDAAQLDASANDIPANWCYSSAAFNGGDFGTPGAPNQGC